MCQNPRSILSAKSRKDNVKTIPVPCGSCTECKKARLSAWLFRFEVELRHSTNPLFVTLTYSDETVPWGNGSYSDITTRKTHGYKSLNPRDVQLFMKKLRFHHAKKSKSKLVAFTVGEYGSRTLRPHYHLILLNLTTVGQRNLPNGKIHNPLLSEAWEHGFDYTLPQTDGSIEYVFKYITKPKKNPPGTLKTFSRASKGIGAAYLTKEAQLFHLQSPRFSYHRLSSGAKVPLIKYYKEKLFTNEQRLANTEYQQQRSEETRIRKITALANRNRLSFKDAENLLELRKKAVTMPPEVVKINAL